MINRKYLSGLITDAHLHAGGNLFGLIYQNCLSFLDSNKVEFTSIVIDAFRPMDESDIQFLNNYKITGEYYYNEKGYLICDFKSNYWKFTGMVSPYNTDYLAFSVYDSRLLRSWSQVFVCTK